MIIIVLVYNCFRKISMEKPNCNECVTMSLWEKPRQSYPKYSTMHLSILLYIQDVILALETSTSTMLTGVLSGVSRYNSSFVIMSDEIITRNRILPVYHWTTVDYFTGITMSLNIESGAYT